MKNSAVHKQTLEERLLQHEQTITQLLAIIAATNTKVTELAVKQAEQELFLQAHPLPPQFSGLPATSRFSPNMPPSKE